MLSGANEGKEEIDVGITWLDVFFSIAPQWLSKLVAYVGPPIIGVWCLLMMVLIPVALWRYISPPPKE